MESINEVNHTAIIYTSLRGVYNKARLTGRLRVKNLYFLDAISKLLIDCDESLTHDQRTKLSFLYNYILITSKYICKGPMLQSKIATINSVTDFVENISSSVTQTAKIDYWQEDSYTNTITEIRPNVLTRTKLSTSYDAFTSLFKITYSSVGRICFLLNDTSSSYSVFDYNGTNITESFDIIYASELSGVLMVSKNIYSYGEVQLKIIKTNI